MSSLLFVAVTLLSAAIVHAVPSILEDRQAPPQLAQVITKCSANNTAALTFDDGPYIYIKNVTDQLAAAGAKGTFFVNGNNYGCIYSQDNQDGLRYAYDHDHQIASHTWFHKHLNTLAYPDLQSEFSRTDEALQRILGVTPAFMRPPYGEYNDQVRQVAAERGQNVIIWDFDSGDSVGKTPQQSNQAYDNLIKSRPSSILTLNHEVYEPTVHQVLPHAISALTAAGYQLVTVAECLGMEPYQSIGLPQTGTWAC